MANPERKILVPDGDTAFPHPPGVVCKAALRLRDELLRIENMYYRETPIGRCSRKTGGISGCLVEIIPRKKTEKTPL